MFIKSAADNDATVVKIDGNEDGSSIEQNFINFNN